MMKISPVNPVVHDSIKKYLTKDKFGTDNFFDYDRCQYSLYRSPDEPEVLKFGFNCLCYKQIMDNGGQEMLDALYKENQLPDAACLPNFEVTLGIDTSKMEKTQKIKKTMTEEETAKVREENEKIRVARDAEAQKIADKFACFKRDFMSAPIRKAITMIQAKKDGYKPCQIDYRQDESYWVTGTKDDVSVCFQVHFDNQTDQSLARIFLLELADSGRGVTNAQGCTYHDKTNSDEVTKYFPKAFERQTSNGCITFKVGKQALERGAGPELPLSQLIGFRQYLKSHLDAVKIHIHSRLRKRVNNMELIVRQARRDEDSAVTYKDKHGGENVKVAKEEKKQEEVFKFR